MCRAAATATDAHFNPRTPRGGATHTCEYIKDFFAHFNPRTPRGGATRTGERDNIAVAHFNPRTPRGGATWPAQMQARDFPFQSTHPARGCDLSCCSICGLCVISIHAPREGVRQETITK